MLMDNPSAQTTQAGARVALIAGATGLVGAALLSQLRQDSLYHELIVTGRRPPAEPAGLRFVASSKLSPSPADIGARVDDAFCCLGTTLRKAGSRAAFEQVDFHLVLAFARAARAAGARRFIVVSSIGAAPSAMSFYLRVKSRMEEAVAEVGFDAVHVLRPSLLLGDREEVRVGERVAQILLPRLAPLMRGPLSNYRPVSAPDVAASMRVAARMESKGLHVHATPLQIT
jgi:uncharacterized protein YbjT (DUF2867 family)